MSQSARRYIYAGPLDTISIGSKLYACTLRYRRLPRPSFSTFPYLERTLHSQFAALRLCILRRRDLMDEKSQKGKGKDVSASAPPHRPKDRLKFTPRMPTKKASKIVPKMEPEEENELQAIDKELLMKLRMAQSAGALERRSRAEKNEAHVKVAFGQVNPPIARSSPTHKSSSSVKQEMIDLFSNYMMSEVTTSAAKLPKQSAGPQDFTHPSYNYPPTSLPLRRPFSGDPVFDEDELGEFSSNRTEDGELTEAKELGLMDTEDMMNKPQLLFFQFPASLPLPMVESVAEADMDISEDDETDDSQSKENYKKRRLEAIRGCKLKDMPGGLLGKVLVYKSGKVKMRLGDALFDVSAGMNCAFAQAAVAINTNKKHCCSLGEVNRRAIVTPDIEYLVGSVKRIG
ncbi:hypothetical protein ACQ4PT_014779 [Festuca glaucescens]